jgi:hypothetical protein
LNTVFLLMAQYAARADVPIAVVCLDYFAPLTSAALLRKISSREIALPTPIRMKKIAFALGFCLVAASSNAAPRSHQENGHAASTTAVIDPRGTTSQPLAVSVVPEPKSEEDQEKDAYERGEKRALDRRMTDYTGRMADLTTWMMLIAAAQAALFSIQLWMMRSTLRDSKLASEAAQASVAVARDSMIIGNRAYVQFNGFKGTWFHDQSGALDFLRIEPQWTNTGNTPTATCKIYVGYEPTIEPLDFNQHQFIVPSSVQFAQVTIAPNSVLLGDQANIPVAKVIQIRNGECRLYVWGSAVYKSVFPGSQNYETRFCVQVTEVTGDLTVPVSPTNLSEIRTKVVGPYNGSN